VSEASKAITSGQNAFRNFRTHHRTLRLKANLDASPSLLDSRGMDESVASHGLPWWG